MTNAEKYKTAQVRAEAFTKFCYQRQRTDSRYCEYRGENHCPICTMAWLDLEAEEEKPLPCPFCGGETEANNCVGGWCVQCDCGYVSKQFNEGNDDEVLKAEAIAAHNRVAKKCREVGE